jgi:hypothetical protein
MSYEETTAFLQAQATNALNQASNNASRIYSLPPPANLREPRFDVELTKPVLEAPPQLSDLFSEGDTSQSNIAWLDAQADAWLNKYFPEINGCFRTQPEETLCAIISGAKPFGVDKTVFEQVWNQARDRAYRGADSETKTLRAEFSARGFTLPPGAMVDLHAQAERRASDVVLDVNRDQAIKDADIKVDLLKTALELATRLKLGVMSAMADFYRLWVSLPDKDIERARIRAQAMGAFYSALSSYYNVEISFQELTLRAAQAEAGVDVDVDRNRLTRQNTFGSVAGALGQAVNAFAGVAEAANVAGGTLSAQIESL